jgi:hypothetical protein
MGFLNFQSVNLLKHLVELLRLCQTQLAVGLLEYFVFFLDSAHLFQLLDDQWIGNQLFNFRRDVASRWFTFDDLLHLSNLLFELDCLFVVG